MEARSALQRTIQEVLENAPPEPELLALVLAALIEARFTVWPRAERGNCGPPLNPPPQATADIFE
jgi:hypothetical protein